MLQKRFALALATVSIAFCSISSAALVRAIDERMKPYYDDAYARMYAKQQSKR